MTTISEVCARLFPQITPSHTEKGLTRGVRRNKAKIFYRTLKRPGLVNPQNTSEEK